MERVGVCILDGICSIADAFLGFVVGIRAQDFVWLRVGRAAAIEFAEGEKEV
jgi:hypothetical protein